jgi:hypothetical protein
MKLNELTKITVNTSNHTAYETTVEVEGIGQVRISEVLKELAARSRSTFVQQVTGQTARRIPITINGGILAEDDDYVEVTSQAGIIFQGGGATQYTIDRSKVPNEIVLGQTPIGPLNLSIRTWI